MRHSKIGRSAADYASASVDRPKPEVPKLTIDPIVPDQQQPGAARYEPVSDATLPAPADKSTFLLAPAGEDIAQPVETIDAGESFKIPGGWKLTTSIAGVSFAKGDAPNGSETKRSGSIELEIASGTKLIIAYAVATGEAIVPGASDDHQSEPIATTDQIGSSVDVGSTMGENSNG